MGFTEAEKQRRHGAIQKLLKEKNLQALVLIGNMTVGHSYHGDFRYYTNNHVFFQRQVAVVFPGAAPVLFNYSDFSRRASVERSLIDDCRVSTNFIADTVELIKAQGASRGRIGVNFEMLPATWYTYLRTELAKAELLDVHDEIMEIRFQHSDEEIEVYRKGAALADAGFEAALRVIRPGVSEYEIIAEIEHVSRKQGADEHFTLIGSGRAIPAPSRYPIGKAHPGGGEHRHGDYPPLSRILDPARTDGQCRNTERRTREDSDSRPGRHQTRPRRV
jgi:Xaa-Pro aminopeptidase